MSQFAPVFGSVTRLSGGAFASPRGVVRPKLARDTLKCDFVSRDIVSKMRTIIIAKRGRSSCATLLSFSLFSQPLSSRAACPLTANARSQALPLAHWSRTQPTKTWLQVPHSARSQARSATMQGFATKANSAPSRRGISLNAALGSAQGGVFFGQETTERGALTARPKGRERYV